MQACPAPRDRIDQIAIRLPKVASARSGMSIRQPTLVVGLSPLWRPVRRMSGMTKPHRIYIRSIDDGDMMPLLIAAAAGLRLLLQGLVGPGW